MFIVSFIDVVDFGLANFKFSQNEVEIKDDV